MQTLILTLHIVVCLSLVILVLLQAGKEGMGVIFGGGSSSMFGSGGAGGILSRLTAFMAVLFVITSLSYNYVSSSRASNESSIIDVKIEETAPAKPAVPATPAAPSKPASQAPAPSEAAVVKPASEIPAVSPATPEANATKPGVSQNATTPAKK